MRAPGWRYRLEFPAGKVLYETAGWISHPRISPTGDEVAFLDHPVFGDDRGSVAIVDRTGRKTHAFDADFESAQGLPGQPPAMRSGSRRRPPGTRAPSTPSTPSGRQRAVATLPSGMTLRTSREGASCSSRANTRLGFLGFLPGEPDDRDLSGLDWSYRSRFCPRTAGPSSSRSRVRGEVRDIPSTCAGWTDRPRSGWARATPSRSRRTRSGCSTARVRSTPTQLVLLPTGVGEPKAFPKDPIEHFGERAFFVSGKTILFTATNPGVRRAASYRTSREERRNR